MRNSLIIILTILFSCNLNQEPEKITNKVNTIEISSSESFFIEDQSSAASKTEIIETFIDSVNIGEMRQCKIELIKHRVNEDNYIIIKFYRKEANTWYIQNTYCYETNALMEFKPNISDFNNDNFNDITFISGSAMRAANEIRRLFIYDKEQQKLISILNSEDFPNIQYNQELNCIDALIFTGGTSTHFARIKGDSLIEFARVLCDDFRTVYEIDKFGNERIISKDSMINFDHMGRYINYKPLKH